MNEPAARSPSCMNIEDTYRKAFELRCEGRYDEARAAFVSILTVQPDHADSRWQLGLIQGFEGDFDGSIATLLQVVAANPGHTKARYDLAMTQMMLGYLDEARANFEQILRDNPNHEEARRQLVYF